MAMSACSMRIRFFAVLATSGVLAAGFSTSDTAPLTPREKAIHALNRLGFGPRPGDVDRILRIGVQTWISEQLHPDRINDTLAAAKLSRLPTLSMSTIELFDTYERPLRDARQERKRELAKTGRASDDIDAADVEKMRAMIPPEKRPRRIVEELSAARVLRAAYSDRQLNEVMVDFWMNHFNVYAAKGLELVFLTSFERDVVRPRIWGKFDDLLMATAKSPAMLFYLDNAQSAAEEDHRPPRPARGPFGFGFFPRKPGGAAPQKKAPTGLNENYARELMELHTLGVEGGYTQRDVTELARVLTGWSIDRRGGEEPGGFIFRWQIHDIGPKRVLLWSFPPGGGIEEGERMIEILAHHPSTAHHIARELVQRLVADDPPPALVEHVARTFLATDGDLRQTVAAVIESPEFFDPKYYRAKVKSPFEYVVSAVRASGGEMDEALPVVREIASMGEPLYLCQPPTGYSDLSSAWVNTGAFVARLNFALALASNRIQGIGIDLTRAVSAAEASDPNRSVDLLARKLIGSDLSPETRATIAKRLEADTDVGNADSRLQLVAGLILGSPEFQKQ
jgi:uncharacterized protein (DUF1800 family)